MVECKGPQHCPHITELPPQPLPWWHQVLWWLRDSAQHCLHHLQTPALSHRVSLGSWYWYWYGETAPHAALQA